VLRYRQNLFLVGTIATLVCTSFLFAWSYDNSETDVSLTQANPRAVNWQGRSGNMMFLPAGPASKTRAIYRYTDSVDCAKKLATVRKESELCDESLSLADQILSLVGDGESSPPKGLTEHDETNQWLTYRTVRQTADDALYLATLGDAGSLRWYRVCSKNSSTCFDTAPNPCATATREGGTHVIASTRYHDQLLVTKQCATFDASGAVSISIYASTKKSSGWKRLTTWSVDKSDFENVTNNTFIGPSPRPNGALSLVYPDPNKRLFIITNFNDELSQISKIESGPFSRSRLPIAMLTYEGLGPVALWLDGGQDLLPKDGVPLAVTMLSNGPVIAYTRLTENNIETLCRRDSQMHTSCTSLPENDAPFNWEFRTVQTNKTGTEDLQYLWIPANKPSKKWAVSVMGGPFYSPFAIQFGQAQALARYGYNVVVPLPTGGSHRWSFLPGFDPRTLDPVKVASELDTIITHVSLEQGGEAPILAGASGAAWFIPRVSAPIRGVLLDSPDCFPSLALDSGMQLQALSINRADIKDDDGLRLRLFGSRPAASSCNGLANIEKPVYVIVFDDDPNLGKAAVAQTKILTNSFRNGHFVLLKGRRHTIDDTDPEVGQIKIALDTIEGITR
jgi:hypothetical protein